MESSLLAFEIGDRSGVIECNIFGEAAGKFENILKEDQVYEIANGVVNENSYLGSHKLKINLMESSKVSIKEDDPSIPYLEDFCLTVKKLTELAVGEEARVICLVKVPMHRPRTSRRSRRSLPRTARPCGRRWSRSATRSTRWKWTSLSGTTAAS